MRVKSRAPVRPVQDTGVDEPAWLTRLQKDLPPYADEMVAFLLIGIGLLSFLTLLSPESGQLGSAWSGVLRQYFGVGAFVISGVILAAGALLLVPKLGIPVRVRWLRLAAGEVFFVLLLAYIHAAIRASVGGQAGEIEAFAQAMEGRGGGMVGWAIQDLIHMLLGDMITGVTLLVLMAVSAALMIGVRRQNLLDGLTRLQAWLSGIADRLEPSPAPVRTLPATPVTAPVAPQIAIDTAAPGPDGQSPAGLRIIEEFRGPQRAGGRRAAPHSGPPLDCDRRPRRRRGGDLPPRRYRRRPHHV